MIVDSTDYLHFGTRWLLHFCPRGQTPRQQQKLKNPTKKTTKQHILGISHQNMQNRTGEISAKTKNLNSNIFLKN